MENLFDLSLAAQVTFGAGYAAYLIAYAGLRRHHETQDAVFNTLAFGVPAIFTFQYVDRLGPVVTTLIAGGACLFLGALWRVGLRSMSHKLLAYLRIHRDDGLLYGWDQIVNTNCSVGQVSVHTKDGRVLYLNNRDNFAKSPFEGLYLGTDGSIILAVEEEEFSVPGPLGPEEHCEVRDGVVHPEQGTRMTYIPADQVARVNIRMLP